MPQSNNRTNLRPSVTVKPFPDWRHVQIFARLGLDASISTAWRRPGGRTYLAFGGSIHESDTTTARRLRLVSGDAAEIALHRDGDER